MRHVLFCSFVGLAFMVFPALAEPKVGEGVEQGAEKRQSTEIPDKTGASAGDARSEGTGEGRQTRAGKKAGSGGQ